MGWRRAREGDQASRAIAGPALGGVESAPSWRIGLCGVAHRVAYRRYDLDRLGLVAVEPRRHGFLAVSGHHRGCHRNHRERARPWVRPQLVQRLDPVHPRQLDIHEDGGGRRRLRQPDPLLRRLGLDRPIAVKPADVALQLPVLLVVLDNQDQLAGHQRLGSVNVKVDPRPGALSTQIRPPCSSTNFFARVRPRPVPSCLRVSSWPTWRNSSKIAAWSSGAMPMPVSVTAISTMPFRWVAFRQIRPPSGVNLTALERRFSSTCLTLRSSPTSSSSPGSMSSCREMPCRVARSLHRVTAFSRAVGRWKGTGASSMRPASILERSRMSLISDRRCWPEA